MEYVWVKASDKFKYVPGNGTWTSSTINACVSNSDSVGVYLNATHSYVTKMFGSSKTISDRTIMRFEPLTADVLRGGTARMSAWLGAAVRRRRSRKRDERGYIATVVALLVPAVFLGCCALSVDMARWYVEAERVQRAADAAALAGVVWMPADFATAKTTALAEAKKNGYDDAAANVVVTVERG